MDNTRRALLRSWLTKAASDLKSARVLGSVDDAPLDTAIYHCQQTAEKAVKAFLVPRNSHPRKPTTSAGSRLRPQVTSPASTR